MKLPHFLYGEMLDHVLESVPREACGLVAALPGSGIPSHVYRCSNVALHPENGYRVDPDDQEFAMWAMEQSGWRLGAVYHSHPAGRACLSTLDLAQAAPDGVVLWPGIVQLVWGISDLDRSGVIVNYEHRLALKGTRLVQDGPRCRCHDEPLELV